MPITMRTGLTVLMHRLNPRGPEHEIPIDGNIYKGTATLKSAVSLYRQFRNACGGAAGSAGAPAKRRPQKRLTRRPGEHWPVWQQPNNEDSLEIARAMAPFVQFRDPGIIYAVAEDNRRLGAEWSSRLEALGIDPRHLSLGRLALRFSGSSTLCRKHGDCGVPETGRTR